jgi:hypothetical protein
MWKANKFVNISLWVLAVISILLCVYVFIQCGKLNARIAEDKIEMLDVISPLLIWVYILVGITAVLAIFLPIPYMIKNPKSATGILTGLVAFGLVVGIAYLFSSGDPLPFIPGHPPVSEGMIKYTDVNLISVYIMLGATIFVTVASSIVNIFKLR